MANLYLSDQDTNLPDEPYNVVPGVDPAALIPESLGIWLAGIGSVAALVLAAGVWFIGPLVLTRDDGRLIFVITATLVIVSAVLATIAVLTYL